MAREVRLEGRRREVSQLRQHLQQRPRTHVVVRGPAGIGKTRLVVEAVADLGTTRWLRAGAERPLPPLVTPSDDGAHDRDLVATTSALRAELTASAGPPLLVVDDAHHLDPGAAAVVADIVDDARISVVLTVRDGEPLPGHVEPLVTGGDQLVLEPLADRAIERLVSAIARAPLAVPAAGHIQRLAEGNPLYARELVIDALRREQLVPRSDGTLDLDGVLEAPAGLYALVEHRVADLPPDARRLLAELVLAEPLPLGITSRLAPGRTYAVLERAGLTDVRDGAVGTAHPLIAEVVAAGFVAGDRARRSAALLERIGRDHPDGVRRAAVWALEAGVPDRDLLLDGARIAVARLDHDLAGRFAERAADAGAGVEAQLLLALAAAGHQGGAAEAEDRLAALEAVIDDDRLRSRAAFARARNLLFGLGRPDLALEAAERSLAALGGGPWHVEVRAIAALAAMLTGEVDRAVAAGEGLAEDIEDPRSRATVEVMVTLARTLAGRFEGTRARIELAQRLLHEVPPRDHLPLATEQLALTTAYLELYTGDVTAAAAHTTTHLDRVVARDSPMVGTWLAMASYVALVRGDLPEVVRLGTDAIAALEQVDLLRTLPLARCVVASAQGLLGQTVLAEEQLDRLRANDPDPPARTAVNVGRAEAARLAATGDLAAAAARALAAGELGLASQHRVWAAFAFHDAVRWGASGAAGALSRLAEQIDGGLVALLAADARARHAGDPTAIVTAGDALLTAGTPLAAAESYLAAGRAAERRGDRDAARYLQRAATVLGDRPRAGPVADVPAPLPLGGREREVARLAAAGHPNREIAEGLVVTPRTVENHLASVYRKLGVTNRDDLARLGVVPR